MKKILAIFFADDIDTEIHEAESVKRIIEDEKIRIDEANNYLLYGDSAAIVNVSAFSIKQLYVKHNTNLLSLNLRYHITGGNVDKEIRETINNDPDSFWLKNNGLTIICDDFKIDGTEVRLWNFSIINGGQTTYILSKSNITASRDLWLPCKIIKTSGATADEKIAFSLAIAKAANAQKAIKPSDLKANSPEQQRFAQAMREVEIFYQTKRGEKPDKRYRDEPYRQTKLLDVGKLCLAAIFQEPCKSRSKPSSVYSPKYYELIFNSNQKQIATLCRELLYMDYYFSKKYLIEFDRDNKDMPDASLRTTFAHTARTICIAFTALAARRYQGNITDSDLTILTSANADSAAYKILCNLGEMKYFLPMELYTDSYNTTLDRLFTAIIEEGVTVYAIKCENDKSLTGANFLKNDKNYYEILRLRWSILIREINKIFGDARLSR